MITLLSWNVNGIRSVAGKGLFEFMNSSKADIICLQETKAQPVQLSKDFHRIGDYWPYWSSAQKKGYSGVVTYTKIQPRSVTYLGIEEFDNEGRCLITDFGDLVLFNCYFPNSQDAGARLPYKLRFCQAILEQCNMLRQAGRNPVVCGDFNIAHQAIDLEHPAANVQNPGYLPEERAWLDSFVQAGYVDTFRHFHPEPKRYSWWSYRTYARERNIGWRLDYFTINPELIPRLIDADILDQIPGSDHCPVTCTLEGDLNS